MSLSVGMPRPLGADAKWIRVSTSHFTMFTSNGERRAKETLLHFEQVRTFFQKATNIAPKDDEVVQVVAFQNEKEYKPYQLNAGATAYYERSQSQDYIVMADIEVDHYPVAVHEYTHLVVEHAGLKLPIWFNEGLAELYSSIEPQGEKTMVGRPDQGRVQALQRGSWLDVASLFAVTAESPYYTQPDKMQIFYAESWLLMHMLVLGSEYSAHFPAFMKAVSGGLSSEAAIGQVYGKSLKALNFDLHTYFAKSSVRVAILPIKLTKADEPINVAPADDLELRLTLAQLLIGTNRGDQAARELAHLSKEYPDSALVEESLMDLAFQRSDSATAQSHCLRAFGLGSRNGQMLYNCATLVSNAGGDPKKIMPLLQRVIEIQPNNRDARLLVGFTLLRQDLFGQSLAALSEVKSVPPDRASQFYSAEGYAMLRLGNEAEAKKAFALAKKWARTPADNLQADRFLETLQREDPRREAYQNGAQNRALASASGVADGSRQAPNLSQNPDGIGAIDPLPVKKLDPYLGMSKAKGLLTKIECSGTGFRFHLRVNDLDQVYAIAKAEDVLIRNTEDNETLTFHCGDTLNKSATIYFLPPGTDSTVKAAAKAAGPVNGIAKRIEFEKNN